MTYLEPDRDSHPESERPDVISRRRGEVQIDEWVAPEVSDAQGFVRTGTALEWMNAAGAIAAARFAHAPVVTVAIDGLRVRRRVATGDRVALRARVVHTSERSIAVTVAMSAGPGRAAVDALMTFAVVGPGGHAEPVPRFYPRSIEELAGHHEAEARARFRRDLAADLAAHGLQPSFAHHRHAPACETGIVVLLRELGARLVGRHRGDPDARPNHVSRMQAIESCAAMSAAAFLSAPPRLLGIDGVAFLRPAPPSAVVMLDATAVHSDDLGVTIMVRGRIAHPRTAPALRGFFTYAPIDATCAIPSLARFGRDEAVHCEVALRHRLREAITDLRS